MAPGAFVVLTIRLSVAAIPLSIVYYLIKLTRKVNLGKRNCYVLIHGAYEIPLLMAAEKAPHCMGTACSYGFRQRRDEGVVLV